MIQQCVGLEEDTLLQACTLKSISLHRQAQSYFSSIYKIVGQAKCQPGYEIRSSRKNFMQ